MMFNTGAVCRQREVSLLGLDDPLLEIILAKAAKGRQQVLGAEAACWFMWVCRRFRAVLRRIATSVTVKGSTTLLDLSGCSHLRKIHLEGCMQLPWRQTGAEGHSLAHLRHLTALECVDCGEFQRRSSLDEISFTVTLQQLALRRCRLGAASLSELVQRLTQLKSLTLASVTRASAEFETAPLASLTQLTLLDLSGSSWVDDNGLADLSGLTALQHLNLHGCCHMDGHGLALLTSLAPSLLHLDLSECVGLRIDNLKHIAKLTSLQHLSLSDSDNHYISSNGFAELAALTALTSLDLSRTNFMGTGLRGLSTLVQLRRLNLQDCRMDDDDVQHFAPFTVLQELDVSYTGLSDEALESGRTSGHPYLCDGVRVAAEQDEEEEGDEDEEYYYNEADIQDPLVWNRLLQCLGPGEPGDSPLYSP